MSVESELTAFLEDRIGSAARQRDSDLVAYFYGFRGDQWPTLEDVAGRFGFSNRERPRQIRDACMDSVQIDHIPALRQVQDFVGQREYWLHNDLKQALEESQLAGDEFSPAGLFELIKAVGGDNENDYGIFTLASRKPGLHPVTRNTLPQSERLFVIRPSDARNVNPLYRKARTLPGQYGIANLTYLADSFDQETFATYQPLLVDLIRQSQFAWTHETADEIWYNFEDRDNVLINFGEKVFSVIGECEVSRLAEVFHNALDRRAQPHPYPAVELVEQYLRSSRYFDVAEGKAGFVGQIADDLNAIEQDVVDFLRDRGTASSPDLRLHLSKLGHGRALVTKAISASPFVHVDRSKGRQHHEYSLVGTLGGSLDRYQKFSRQLAGLEQTDEPAEAKQRREQPILRRWLFEDKTTECCAICGDEHMVSALRAAHKKKRSQCTEAERRDPYVVMPVCIFGCDFLYEERYIIIEDGMVRAGSTGDFGEADLRHLQKVTGRALNDEWLRGPSSYFSAD